MHCLNQLIDHPIKHAIINNPAQFETELVEWKLNK